MNKLFRDLDFTWFSFLIGFLAGSLFWWLLRKIRPRFEKTRETLKTQTQTSRREGLTIGELRFGNDLLKFVQGLHIAAPLFSLDEVYIPIRLFPPPQEPTYNEEILPSVDITDSAVPYLPDWPEFASRFNAPAMTLIEALQGDAHIVLIGDPGSGKSVALAHLATEIVKNSHDLGKVSEVVPLFVRAADLGLQAEIPEDLFTPIILATSVYASSKTSAQLPALISSAFQEKRALVLIDGLDEFPPTEFDKVVFYLEKLQNAYPDFRMVVSASSAYMGRLLNLDFMPMVLANWNTEQRAEFLMRWGALWTGLISPKDPGEEMADSQPEKADPMLTHGWLLHTTALLNPLELTLKTWAAYAGDMLGPKPIDSIESYVRRMTFKQSPMNRHALEEMCSQMVLTMQPVTSQNHANQWLAGGGAQVPPEALSSNDPTGETQSESTSKNVIRAPGALTDLIECGLVREHPLQMVSVTHPVLTGYLASLALAKTKGSEQLLTQPDWSGQQLTLQYLAAQDLQAAWTQQLLVDERTDVILQRLLNAAKWLKNAPDKASWSSNLMRTLASYLQKGTIPFGLKARIISALVVSGDSGVSVLFRQMLESPNKELRQLSALGSGILRDSKAISEISRLIEDPDIVVSRSAILALVAIGDNQALERVAYALIHGDERLSQAAAEGLANDPEDGHPTLKEASEFEDHTVRRSVVFGLARIDQPWAIKILEDLRSLDDQWMVQDAASQILDEKERPNPRLPHRHPALTHTPWLIEYAGNQGIGVAPGKPAYDLVYSAMKNGTEEEKLAALYFLCYHGDESSLLPLYRIYFSSSGGEIQEAALNALWHLDKSGYKLPAPMQYDLR